MNTATCSSPSSAPRAGFFMHIHGGMTEASSVDFLRRLKLASPIKISKILTDNGSQFTDRFTTKDQKPSGKHAFDAACAGIAAEHRLATPRHPQTTGMVERFNGRINALLQQTRFDSKADLEATLMNYLKRYNHHIPQRAVDNQTPILASRSTLSILTTRASRPHARSPCPAAPYIRFLFIDSHFRSTPPRHGQSPFRSCAPKSCLCWAHIKKPV
jgi:hypothetical protein